MKILHTHPHTLSTQTHTQTPIYLYTLTNCINKMTTNGKYIANKTDEHIFVSPRNRVEYEEETALQTHTHTHKTLNKTQTWTNNINIFNLL